MSNEENINLTNTANDNLQAADTTSQPSRKGRRGSNRGRREGGGNKDQQTSSRVETDWAEKVIQVSRVTKVVKGGKKLSFRAVVAVGNGRGQVGVGVGKAAEVIGAIQKAITDGRKSLIEVPLIGTTIPHPITGKLGSSRVLMKPASNGTGIIAGGAARAIIELSGISDVLTKSLGSRCPLNVARATIDGLKRLRTFEHAARLRNISIKQMLA